MSRLHATLLLRADVPPCACGSEKVIVLRDGIEPLIDNMGCELGLEKLTGPLCPRCEADDIAAARQPPAAPPRLGGPQAGGSTC